MSRKSCAKDLLKNYRFKEGDYVKESIHSGRVVRVEHENAQHTSERYDVLLFPHGRHVVCDSNDIVANPDGEREEWVAVQQTETRMLDTYRKAQASNETKDWEEAWVEKLRYAKIMGYQRLIREVLA